MRLYFVLMAIGLVFSSLSGAAMSWDGGVYLFEVLDSQAPFMMQQRFINVPLQIPVLFASHVTSDVRILIAVHGLSYALVPFLALIVSWWVVRGWAPFLFIWPALGIGLGTLPGQFYFQAESILAIQMAWPAILGTMSWVANRQKRTLFSVLALVICMLSAHPFGLALTAVAGGVAIVCTLADSRSRMGSRITVWILAAVLLSMSVLAAANLWTSESVFD